jgi:hypothetical protein
VTESVDPPSLAPETCDRIPISVAAVQAGDSVIVTPPAGLDPGMVATADAGAGTIGLRLCNPTADAIDAGATEFRLLVIR